ncbi:MAG: cob(I)yrinic acid a,c-diamide adenosyltransferase [Endomicrobiales bacterium]|nr:cob(I)yrinic acid a,c-diamide adenosyltransferase [Endomicrobiales bacterium]
MLYIYTGNGKGKTTAAIGQVMRSLGRGWRVCIIQLFKGKEFYGEQKMFKKLRGLDFYSFAPKHPFCFPKIKKSAVQAQCRQALIKLEKILKSKKRRNLIVLEEFNIAVRDGFMNLRELIKTISLAPDNTYILITGRGASKELIEKADLVTEMKEIKHPYRKGIRAIKGVEY